MTAEEALGRHPRYLRRLLSAAAQVFGVPLKDMQSGRRYQACAEAQHAVRYLLVERVGLRPSQVVKLVGVDRASVGNSLSRARALMETDTRFAQHLKELTGIMEGVTDTMEERELLNEYRTVTRELNRLLGLAESLAPRVQRLAEKMGQVQP